MKRSCFCKQFLLVGFAEACKQLARDGYTFYYPTRDQMDSGRLSSMCSKKMRQLCLLHCALLRRHLFRWTPRCMVLANSTNFIKDMSWIHHRSKPLMTTTTTDMFFVHQTEAQRYPCMVGKSEKCPSWSDGRCSDHQVCMKKMVNVTLWTKMFAQMVVPSDHKRRAVPSHYSKASSYYLDILVLPIDD